MAIFGFGKDKKDGNGPSESVLAYLEDAQRLRTIFTLIGPKKTEITATLQSIEESAGLATFQASGPLIAEKGSKVTFVYIQEGLRLGATCHVADLKLNTVVLDLPGSLEVMERRSQPRARLNPKEGATLTALTGLFEGVGITGTIENISETGARVRVDKAMSLKGEKRLPLGTSLLPPGQLFMLIKLNKLPKCPSVMELEGKAAYLESTPGGLVLGVTLSKSRPDYLSALRNLVNARTTPIPSTVPPKTRRKAVEASPSDDEESLLPPPRRTARAVEEPKAPPVPAAPEPAPLLEPPTPLAALPEAPVPEALPKNDALVRMKKRSRAVVALASTPVSQDLLMAFLQEEGYGRVLVTTSLEELLGFLQMPNLGLLFLDGEMSTLEALSFVRKITEAFPKLPPIILAAEDVSISVVMAAQRSGVSQMLVRPYAMDGVLSDLVAKQMGC
jgi:CheY-like chemotaxis protein